MKIFIVLVITLLNTSVRMGSCADSNPSPFSGLPWIPNMMSEADKKECNRQFDEMQAPIHPDIGLSIPGLLRKYKYRYEEISAETEDGYILTMFRVTGKESDSDLTNTTKTKEPALLVHGMGADGFVWLIQPDPRNLVMFLVQEGFDVYIANSRGTRYSLKHKTLDCQKDWDYYWDFSFHEMGVYDLPAMIHKIQNITGHEKIHYVGHSLGTTQAIVLLSEKPEYSEHLRSVILLSPAIYLKHIPAIFRLATSGVRYYRFIVDPIFHGRFDFPHYFKRFTGTTLGKFCGQRKNACSVCANYIYSRLSYNPEQMNYTTIGLLTNGFPATVGLKTNIHVLQQVHSTAFCQFDYGVEVSNMMIYGSPKPPCYNLTNIRAGITAFWGQGDNANTPEDVEKFWSDLPPEAQKGFYRVESDSWNHVDYCIAKDADELLYSRMIRVMNDSG